MLCIEVFGIDSVLVRELTPFTKLTKRFAPYNGTITRIRNPHYSFPLLTRPNSKP
jgi:hypothetical protein